MLSKVTGEDQEKVGKSVSMMDHVSLSLSAVLVTGSTHGMKS